MKTEKPVKSKEPIVKCPYCGTANVWPTGERCKHYSGHGIGLCDGRQDFFFLKK